jgi:outer membrane lipase/esterase
VVTLGITANGHATDFNSTIFFGDSLTDSGTFTPVVPPGGGKFTTNPGPVWAENIAATFGRLAVPAVAGGTNFNTTVPACGPSLPSFARRQIS